MSILVFNGSQLQVETTDYSLVDDQLTFVLPPQIGDVLLCWGNNIAAAPTGTIDGSNTLFTVPAAVLATVPVTTGSSSQPNTLAGVIAMIDRWLPGDADSIDDDVKRDVVNDAYDSIWQSLMRASLSQFLSGPMSISIEAAEERVSIVSIADPTVAPTITQTTLGSLAQHTVYSCYTLVTESGSETLTSPIDTTVVSINKVATMASPSFVSGAFGYNCYMGTAQSRMAKQNTDPIEFGATYSEPSTGLTNVPGLPGIPILNTTSDDLFCIRRIESAGPVSGTYQRWEGADIDSMLMSRAALTIPAPVSSQTYVWDLIGGNQLEIRPGAGAAVTPRYFYVKRPRRLAYDNSPTPFTNIPVTEFIRSYSLMAMFTFLKEWEAVKFWDKKAESARGLLVSAVKQQDAPKNQRVIPFMYA